MSPRDDAPRLALVTGGCSGIGRALAGRLAARGHPLVLVSERPEALEAVAAELRARHRVDVHHVAVDLARADAAAELHDLVTGRGLEVDILVNNAGFFFGETVDADPARAGAMLLRALWHPAHSSSLAGDFRRWNYADPDRRLHPAVSASSTRLTSVWIRDRSGGEPPRGCRRRAVRPRPR